MEIYAEQTVLNENIEKKSKRNKILSFTRFIFFACIVLFFFLFMLSPVSEETIKNDIVISFLFFLMSSSPLVFGIIMLTRYLNRVNEEYDYLLSGGVFRVVRVINRAKRKLLIEVNVSSFESLGRAQSETHDRLVANDNVSKHFAICDADDNEVFYIFYKENGIDQMLYICPNEQMAIALKRSALRISVIDKSFNLTPVQPLN